MYKNSIVAKVSTRKEQRDRTRKPLDINKDNKEELVLMEDGEHHRK